MFYKHLVLITQHLITQYSPVFKKVSMYTSGYKWPVNNQQIHYPIPSASDNRLGVKEDSSSA